MYKEYKDKGFTIIAVNYGDPADTIKKYVKQGKFTFPIVMNGKGDSDMAKGYGVRAYPTNYVLDSEGKVVARFVGFNEKGLREAVKKLLTESESQK